MSGTLISPWMVIPVTAFYGYFAWFAVRVSRRRAVLWTPQDTVTAACTAWVSQWLADVKLVWKFTESRGMAWEFFVFGAVLVPWFCVQLSTEPGTLKREKNRNIAAVVFGNLAGTAWWIERTVSMKKCLTLWSVGLAAYGVLWIAWRAYLSNLWIGPTVGASHFGLFFYFVHKAERRFAAVRGMQPSSLA